MTRLLAIATAALWAISALAQPVSTSTLTDVEPLKFSVPPLQPNLEWPVTPGYSPMSPLPRTSLPANPAQFEFHTPQLGKWSLADSLQAVAGTMRISAPAAIESRLTPSHSPYGQDWQRSGIIAKAGEGYIGGFSSRQAFPAMGNMASAGIYITQPIGDNMTITAGLNGTKYHFDRSAWNDYGIWGSASYRLNETLTLKAFGEYYINPTYHSMASMAMIPSSSYGAALGIKVSDKFSVDVGAQRYYDVLSGKWRTVPIVAPTLKVWGQPISIDFGGLIYDILKSLIDDYHAKKQTIPMGPMQPRPMQPGPMQPNGPMRTSH